MTTNSVVLIAVLVAVTLVSVVLAVAVTYRFRADKRQLAGGSILAQAVEDIREEDAIARAAAGDDAQTP